MAFDGTLKFDTAIDKTGFEAGLSALGSLAKKGMAVVTGAVTAAGAGVAALGGYAVSVGKDFESSMAQVIATMGITKTSVTEDGVNSFQLLKEAASAAGESTIFSASEAADALNYLALAGYDAAKAADALPAVLNLAAAGGMELAYASDLATDAMAALGIEATSGNLTRFGDEMAKTASKANTSVSQLGEAILTVGGTAKSLTGGTTELNAALGILANRGIKGSEGGTALRNMILSLSAPTDKAAAALEGLGVNAFDANGNLRPLNETFKDLDNALAGMSEGEKTQVLNEIFNRVDLKSAQAMLAGCGEEFNDLTDALENCDGAMADMAHTMNDTLEGDIKSLQSKAEAFGNVLYESLNDPLRELAQLGGDYVSQLTSAFKEGGFEGLADSLGDVLSGAVTKLSSYVPKIADIAVSIVTSLISGLRENIPAIADAALTAATTLVYGIADASGELLKLGGTLVQTLLSGIAEHIPDVAEALQGLLKEIPEILSGDTLSEISDAAVGFVSALGNAVLDNIPVLLPVLAELAVSVISFLADGIPKVLETAQQLITKGITEILPQVISVIGEQLPKIITALTKAIPQIETALAKVLPELVQSIAQSAPDIVQAFADIMPDILQALVDSLDEMYPAVHEAVVGLITSLADLLPVIQETCSELSPLLLATLTDIIIDLAPDILELAGGVAASIIKSTIEIIISLVGNLLAALGQSLADIGDILSDVLISAKEKAVTGVQNIISNVMEWLGTLPERIGTVLGNVLGELAKWAVEAPEKAKTGASELINNVRDYMKQLPTLAKEHLESTIAHVKEWASDLVIRGKSAASDLVSAIVNKISELPDKMLSIGRDIVTGIWNGISGAKDWLTGQISGFADGVISGFKDSFGIHSPSTLMRDQVGRYLAEGIGTGFAENMPDLSAMAQSAVDKLSEVNMPLLEIDIPDFDIPDNRRPPRIPQIGSTAYQALSGIGSLDRNIAPTATAEIINNYSYSTTTTNNNSSAPETAPANITLNATFKVGEEVVAEGVADIAADKIDEHQGVTVELKKRGLAR